MKIIEALGPTGLFLLAAAMLGWLVLAACHYELHKTLSDRFYVRGEFRSAIRLLALARWLPTLSKSLRTNIRIAGLEYLGATRSAYAEQRLRVERFEWRDHAAANSIICTFINAGRYTEALEVGEKSRPGRERYNGKMHAATVALIQVNLSEALYNLGRWDEAWKALDGLIGEVDALGRAGLLNQQCWILANTGRSEEALAMHQRVERRGLPPIFFAEHHFTRVVALLGLGRLDDAELELQTAQSVAMRASSKRNAVFLRARVALARGNTVDAERLFREGSRHRYQGQGGDGLLAWGDCLEKLGRTAEAGETWRLCLKRDPQSSCASVARARLQGLQLAASASSRSAS